MDRLIDFLRQNPILVFIGLAWLAGMIGNAVKVARKVRERGAPPPPRRMPASRPPQAPGGPAPRPSAEDIAAEMRRILGMEPSPGPASPRPSAEPAPVPRRPPVAPERPPTPVVPTTQARRLEIHVDPHVGEDIGRREVRPIAARTAPGLGALGGRAPAAQRRRDAAHRFPLDDLRSALVLSEILGPPLALRPPGPPAPPR
jgi:hypothetical protein